MTTFNEHDVAREHSGQPTGGQFAEKQRPASGISLSAAPRDHDAVAATYTALLTAADPRITVAPYDGTTDDGRTVLTVRRGVDEYTLKVDEEAGHIETSLVGYGGAEAHTAERALDPGVHPADATLAAMADSRAQRDRVKALHDVAHERGLPNAEAHELRHFEDGSPSAFVYRGDATQVEIRFDRDGSVAGASSAAGPTLPMTTYQTELLAAELDVQPEQVVDTLATVARVSSQRARAMTA